MKLEPSKSIGSCPRSGCFRFLMPTGFRLSEGEDESERRSFTQRTLDIDVPFMGIDDVFNDLGAESCPAGFPTERVSSKEAGKNFRRHTTPCVGHGDVEYVGGPRNLSDDCDGSAGRNFRNGVVHQVVEGVEEALFISLDRRQTIKAFAAERDSLFLAISSSVPNTLNTTFAT